MYTAAALLYPDALATSITLPMEILQAASQAASIRQRGRPQVEFFLAGQTPQAMRLASGIELRPHLAIQDLPALDLLLLPAIWRKPRATLEAWRSWLPQLASIAASGTRICSVGSASNLLAEAGMLDGRPATTHWNDFNAFAKRYPEVQLKTRHLITQSDHLYCVGSVNSIADLMVHVVEEWFGTAIARAIENQFSPEIRRPFRAAAYQERPRSAHHDESVLRAQQMLEEGFSRPIAIADIARDLQLSPRSLARRFREATGLNPQSYLSNLRISAARDLLRRSNLSISEVAWQVGLQDVSYFCSLFKRSTGLSPLRYRQAARGKLFDPGADSVAK